MIGIDIGGTKTHAAAFDQRLDPLAEVRVPTAAGGADEVSTLVVDTIAQLVDRIDGLPVAAIGVGIPGQVDQGTGAVRQAVNLGIGDEPLDLLAPIADVSAAPCRIDNDVNVAALGARQILDPEVDDLAYLSIGTGIAAGIVLGGRLHRGPRGVAGEIGHFPVVPDGPRCECGLRGCLEAVASGTAITRRWAGADGRSPAEALITAANSGDDRAQTVLEPITDHLATAIYLLAITYDVSHIVLGGGVADLGQLILDPIIAAVGRLEQQSGFVRSLELASRLVLKPAGPVGTIGAAVLATVEDRR